MVNAIVFVRDDGKSMLFCHAEYDLGLTMEFLKYNDCLRWTKFRGDDNVVMHAAKHMGAKVATSEHESERCE